MILFAVMSQDHQGVYETMSRIKFPITLLLFAVFLAGCAGQLPPETPTAPAETPTAKLIVATDTATPLPPTETSTPQPSPTIEASPTLTVDEKIKSDFAQFNLDPSKYIKSFDSDGKVQMKDKQGNLIYWDGKWSIDMAIKLVAMKNECLPTNFKKAAGTNMPLSNQIDAFETDYEKLLFDQINNSVVSFPIRLRGSEFTPQYIGSANNCWGELLGQGGKLTDLIYLDKQYKVANVPIFGLSQ